MLAHERPFRVVPYLTGLAFLAIGLLLLVPPIPSECPDPVAGHVGAGWGFAIMYLAFRATSAFAAGESLFRASIEALLVGIAVVVQQSVLDQYIVRMDCVP